MADESEGLIFKVAGRRFELSRSDVVRAVKNVEPEPVRELGVIVEGRRFPVKQVFAAATGLDRLDFTSATARRHLDRLGFEVVRSSKRR